MTSLYAKYLTERTSDKIIEIPEGFVTYRYVNEGKSVYILDIYVLPEFRSQGVASQLADQVVAEARAKGCIELFGSVCPGAVNSTISMRVLMGYGMLLDGTGNNLIIFKKGI